MIKNILLWLVNLILLSACVSISEQSLVVPATFEETALVYSYKEPTWRLNDNVYQQTLGKYRIVDAKVSGESTKSTFKERDISLNGFLNWTVFGESLQKSVARWDTTTSQGYSFRLDGEYAQQYLTQCEILSQGVSERINNNPHKNNRTSQSHLLCQIANADETWHLLIEKLNGRGRSARFWQGNVNYDINFSTQISSDKQDEANMAFHSKLKLLDNRLAGIFVYDAHKLISANSLVGEPKVWIHSALVEQETALFLSLNYAISMYDWLSGDLK